MSFEAVSAAEINIESIPGKYLHIWIIMMSRKQYDIALKQRKGRKMVGLFLSHSATQSEGAMILET